LRRGEGIAPRRPRGRARSSCGSAGTSTSRPTWWRSIRRVGRSTTRSAPRWGGVDRVVEARSREHVFELPGPPNSRSGPHCGAPEIKSGHSLVKLFVPPVVATGSTVFSINHRAAPQFRYPTAAEDSQRAIRFVRHNPAKYGIRPTATGFRSRFSYV
jgi:hypothetical protein